MMKVEELAKERKVLIRDLILDYMKRHPDEIFSYQELMRALGLTRGGCQGALFSLAQRGLVEKLSLQGGRKVYYGLPETIKRAKRILKGR